jgi:alkyl sulfatase BDS1-like metallo-beta-lactamase superfamily hydrolase
MPAPLYRTRPGGFDIQPASAPQAVRINEFIYLSPGLSNSFLVVTPEGRVIVNTGMGFEAAVHKRNFDAVDSGPVRYILLTQAHVDHVGGVELLREDATEIVAQAGNPGYQAEDSRLRRARASRSRFAFAGPIAQAAFLAKAHSGPAPVQSAPEPTITFDERYDFELGDLRFELYATPGGETTESMVVWLPQHRICFCGNVFGALFGHIPNLVTIRGDRYRDALTVIDSIERVMALEPDLLLVGHGGGIEGRDVIRSELERLRDAVRYVHDETVSYMNSGKDVFTAMQEIELPPELEVGQGYGKVSWCVRAIWESYLGWFQHRSTSELYGVAPGRVYPELALLAGGAEPIAKRARERLEAGAPLEAIELVEVALSAEPQHRGALAVSLAAHEKLAEEADNFWLLSWLRDQAKTLRTTLEQ